MTDKKDEALKLALKKAFDLGQRWWQLADSEYSSHWKKADAVKERFNQLVEDTIRKALAEQLEQQQEPVAWRTRNAALPGGYVVFQQYPQAVADLGGEIEPLYTSPPASKPWVELTPAEVHDIWCFNHTPQEVCDAVSAKLREKNQ